MVQPVMNKEQVLQACTVHGTLIKLPDVRLDRKIYQEVAKSLELIGGKWKGGKVAGFIFNEDPTDLLAQIANGETRNLKKEFQFFPTPPDIADWMVQLAEIKPEHCICEPSAGQGAIVNAILRVCPVMNHKIACFELMPINKTFLSKIPETVDFGDDFLLCNKPDSFDRIIANPPFSKNQDIDHIRKMYECIKPGGRIVSLSSQHWHLSDNRKETEFREWLSEIKAQKYEIGPGAFKESGTMINTTAIVINKPLLTKPKIIPVQQSNSSNSEPPILVIYSDRAVALFGNTKHLKAKLLELHGSFNRHLKYNNDPTPGWIFSKKREPALRQLLAL